MNPQLININGTDYPLKFGYSAFKVLSNLWKFTGPEQVGKKIALAFKGLDESNKSSFTFKQMDIMAELILSAIIAKNPTVKIVIDADDIATEVLKDPTVMVQIIETYMAAISSIIQPQGKPQPQATNKRQKK